MDRPGLHPAYFEVRFRGAPPPGGWPPAFVIVTAYATTGEVWTDEANEAADAALCGAIEARGLTPTRLTGFDPVTGHAEPGWAVALPPEAARALGAAFRQDAIYAVEGDALRVARCFGDPVWVEVGAFRERWVGGG
jgi:hypothetical protein